MPGHDLRPAASVHFGAFAASDASAGVVAVYVDGIASSLAWAASQPFPAHEGFTCPSSYIIPQFLLVILDKPRHPKSWQADLDRRAAAKDTESH